MIRKSTWIVLLAFIFLIGAVYLWQRKQAEQEAQITPTAAAEKASLIAIEGTLNYIRIERVGDKVIELRKDDQDQWQITSPQGLQTDSQTASSTLSQMTNISVLTTLTEATDLTVLGLEPPVYRILAGTVEGKQYLVEVGKVTPTNSGYYTLGQSRLVQVVSKYTLDSILGLVDAPPILQVTLTPETVETGLPAATESNPSP